jgi:hypothetical protein
MNNAPALLKTLITFAIIVPLAVFVGYTLTNPLDYSTFGFGSVMAVILAFPLLLRWHHPLLVLSWNLSAIVFFLPGRPELWLLMALASMGISLGQRALAGTRFISVPQVTWSLLCMIGVVIFTARMTGMGLRSMGSEVYGGRRYAYLLCGIVAYFALSARRIPPERAGLYIGMFCLAGLTGILSDLSVVMPGPLHYIYLFFPGNYYAQQVVSINAGPLRLGGASTVSLAIFSYMLSKYGLRGIFLSGKSWRWVVLFLTLGYALFGGFRGIVIYYGMMFALQFYLEGLHRTKLLPMFMALGIALAVLLVFLTPKLPLTIQRALAFLPLQIDQQVQKTADESLDWRLEMWKAILPQVPHYLLIGKGYAVSSMDFNQLTGDNAAIHSVAAGFEQNQYFAIAGAYHNGPLSVIMTFGIWGCIAVIWFWVAGMWVLSCNYRYGNPVLQKVNLFLLVAFAARIVYFLTIFGQIDLDILTFSGWLGLSVALNGGVCQPAPAPTLAGNRLQAFAEMRRRLQPALRRPTIQG